jgi:hypothetical protein
VIIVIIYKTMKWMKDPKTGKSSVSVTLLFLTTCVGLVKLLLADMTFGSIAFGAFSAIDYATLISANAGLYGWRKKQDAVSNPSEQ